jgi:hypothetical protein
MSDESQRRSSPRRSFSCEGQYHNPYESQADLERLCVTRDFSRNGLYFIADDHGLRENMRLLVRFPHGPPVAQEQEYLVEVARMKALPGDRCGVGVRLILRAMLGRCRALIAPKEDVSLYSRLRADSAWMVDLHV